MERRLIGLALALCTGTAFAADLHAPYDALLARHVDGDGRVAYRSLAAQDAAALDAYLQALAAADPDAWPVPEQIAFWINAYNAGAIRGVLDGYDAEGFFARRRFFKSYSLPVAGRERTLDQIEHEILRPRFREPRVHFALVCASTSCPKLRREAYAGDRLERQLDEQTRAFLADPRRNRLDGETARASMIFKWFGEDFDRSAGSVPAFLQGYGYGPFTAVEYLDYDWTMNAQPGQRPAR